MVHSIILFSLFGILQYVVRSIDGHKHFRGVAVRIGIGMVLAGKASICCLDLFHVGRAFRQTEDAIQISIRQTANAGTGTLRRRVKESRQ